VQKVANTSLIARAREKRVEVRYFWVSTRLADALFVFHWQASNYQI
jgi:hypothetical protein